MLGENLENSTLPNMQLYHGSNFVIEAPNLKFSRKELDFGVGFYTTTNYEQAKEFAKKVVERKGGNDNILKLLNFIKAEAIE